MRALLVVFWVATALAATAAACAHAERIERRWARRTLVLAVAVLPLAFTAWLAGKDLWMRLRFGDGNAPVALTLGGFLLHAVGLLAFARAARRPSWSPAALPWTAAALVGLALTLLQFSQIELRARLHAARLRLEGGELARGLLAPPPDPAEDAWPRYVELAQRIGSDPQRLRELSAERELLRGGGSPDVHDAAVRARLEWLAPLLVAVRQASALPDCDYAERRGRRASDWSDWNPSDQHVTAALTLSGALAFEGAARLASGDLDGALDDVESILAISRHAGASPVLIDLSLATAVRAGALELLARALPRADAALRDRVQGLVPEPLGPRAPYALDMEFAWGLSTFGLLGDEGWTMSDAGPPFRALDSSMYLVFRFEEDVLGYREGMQVSRALASGSLADLRRELARSDVERRADAWGRGVLAVFTEGAAGRVVLAARRTDASFELVRRALEALGVDREAALAQGTWTDDDPAWGDDPPVFTLGGQR